MPLRESLIYKSSADIALSPMDGITRVTEKIRKNARGAAVLAPHRPVGVARSWRSE
jgi:hypothetical protein